MCESVCVSHSLSHSSSPSFFLSLCVVFSYIVQRHRRLLASVSAAAVASVSLGLYDYSKFIGANTDICARESFHNILLRLLYNIHQCRVDTHPLYKPCLVERVCVCANGECVAVFSRCLHNSQPMHSVYNSMLFDASYTWLSVSVPF